MPSTSSDDTNDQTENDQNADLEQTGTEDIGTENEDTGTDEIENDEKADLDESDDTAKSTVDTAKPSGKAGKAKSTGGEGDDGEGDGGKATGKAKPAKGHVSKAADTAGSSGGDISLTISRSLLKKIGAVVVIVAVLAVLGVGIWQWIEKDRRSGAFDDAKAASEKYVTALISTLNTDKAADSKEILGPLSTGDLRKKLEQDRVDTEKSVTDLKLKVTSKIYFSAVESFSADEAKTVVVAEASGTSAQAPSGASNTMVLRLGLRKEGGKWLVSSVDGLPGNRSGQIDPNNSIPGATTAPATTAPATTAPTPAPAG